VNPTTANRTGTMVAGGVTITITQARWIGAPAFVAAGLSETKPLQQRVSKANESRDRATTCRSASQRR
jgi:hypothetical protein